MQQLREELLPAGDKLPSAHPLRDELAAILAGRRLVACHAAPAIAQAICAVGIVYLKRAMVDAAVDSVTFSFWRFVGSAPLLLLVACAAPGGAHSISSRDAAWFSLLGVLLVLNQLFANVGVQLAGALIATCMQPTTPVISAAMAVGAGQEQPSLRVAAAIALAVTGAIVVAVGRGDGSSGPRGNVLVGFVCLLINASSFGAYVVCMKAVVHKHGAAVVTGGAQAAGLVV
eukprot:1790060-Prymnesium_polylepis.1